MTITFNHELGYYEAKHQGTTVCGETLVDVIVGMSRVIIVRNYLMELMGKTI